METILHAILNSDAINLNNLERLQKALKKRQNELLLNSEKMQKLLLREFLVKMIEKRKQIMEKLNLEMRCLSIDLAKTNAMLGITDESGVVIPQRIVPDSIPSTSNNMNLDGINEGKYDPENSNFSQFALVSDFTIDSPLTEEQFLLYRQRMMKHLNSLENVYLAQRGLGTSNIIPSTNHIATNVSINPSTSTNSSIGASVDDLEKFTQIIHGMTKYTGVKRLAKLNYCTEDQSNNSSIVSSIEFDKDGEYFVIAGVTKLIKIYDYNAVLNYEGQNSYPHSQLTCEAKISNVSWNPYHKNMLASSEYNGVIQVWDTERIKCSRSFREHEKRAWTVQFNNVDPHLMASGSDDCTVKLWNISVENSILTIDAKVNVCCVYFSPKSKNHLVFGSADHLVHLYDIRNTSKALRTFEGHKKAVSYVKYVNESQVISASTDSTLRLWDVATGTCLQTMRGHTNEKNFVGLSTDGQHVVCGSENNQLYLFYKYMGEPALTFDFDDNEIFNRTSAGTPNSAPMNVFGTNQTVTGTIDKTHLTDLFVSAVCWKKNSDVVLAANSLGITHILQIK